MKFVLFAAYAIAVVLAWPKVALAEVKVAAEHRGNAEADASFRFKAILAPSGGDLATSAAFKLLDGRLDPNSPGLGVLHDGKLPREEDEPGANCFFGPGTDGGRIQVDLGKSAEVKRVTTYSWHPSTRGPQVYRLFAADGQAEGFNAEPARPADPAKCGWKLLTTVDTRPATGEPGGQYAASLLNPEGNLGKFRYLLFDISRTEGDDPFGNTFFSEIDIVDAAAPETVASEAPPAREPRTELIEIEGFEIRLDTTDTPDLTDWVHAKVGPMAREWYPKLAKLLASDGYEAPKKVTVVFDSRMRGVAATGGTRVRCAATWFRANLEGEAVGAVFHELVHVVQQYGRGRVREEGAIAPPGWLVEGIADYIRWFKFEPESHGAEITRRNLARARYDGNYRISANFLNWVCVTYDADLVPKLNAAIRQGKYRTSLWEKYTGHKLEDLGAEWKSAMEKKVAAAGSSSQ